MSFLFRSNAAWGRVACVVATVGLSQLPPIASGSQIRLISNPYGTTGGGELRWETVAGSGPSFAPAVALPEAITDIGGTYTTFCLEYNEHIAFDGVYDATLTTAAMPGGQGGGVGGIDPLDARTAFLINSLFAGTLDGYQLNAVGANAAGITRANSANALQYAIWWIEEEWSPSQTGNLTVAEIGLAQTFYALANDAVSSGAWSGRGNVGVMHLQALDGSGAQDQVVMAGPPAVPAPVAVLGGAALLSANVVTRCVRRRRWTRASTR